MKEHTFESRSSRTVPFRRVAVDRVPLTAREQDQPPGREPRKSAPIAQDEGFDVALDRLIDAAWRELHRETA